MKAVTDVSAETAEVYRRTIAAAVKEFDALQSELQSEIREMLPKLTRLRSLSAAIYALDCHLSDGEARPRDRAIYLKLMKAERYLKLAGSPDA